MIVPELMDIDVVQLKKMHQEKQLDTLVDKGLGSKYDRIKLEEMVQVGLLCTQFFPGHRTKMSEVVRMLEGDGLAKRWEASQHAKESHKFKVPNFSFSRCHSDLMGDSSLLLQAVELSGPRCGLNMFAHYVAHTFFLLLLSG